MPSVSEKLFQRALQILPGGVNSPVRAFRAVGGRPFYTASATGCRLKTEDGGTLIDYVRAWGPAIFGHNDPEIRAAIFDALERGTGFGTCHAAEVEMGGLLCDIVPSVGKVRMTNSGTEATMTAIRLARGFTNRRKIIKFQGCFHGHGDALLVKAGSGALTFGHPDSAGVTPGAAADTLALPFNDIGALKAAFAAPGVGEEIAGVILEPFPGNAGFLFPDPGFLECLRELCDRSGAVLIFDEVMTGFRLGLHGSMGLHAVRPDLVCLGKIIGGGFPIGAIGGHAAIMDQLAPLGPVYQSGTFCGHPVVLGAGIAAIRKLQRDLPYKRLAETSATIAAALEGAAREKGIPLRAHHKAGMFSFFFNDAPVRNLDDVLRGDHALFGKVFQYALSHGVFLPPSAFESCFLCTAHDDDAVSQTCEVLANAIKAL
ncbi:MAG: glutamate-1-semialdehyde 2,1-aminomutase [Puniceicoccales bacterium]|jgi:glutamate-1-semialdehyde 2,1-aminomutase|nr:glutamate-1-semialdehyde 2,1-aminomutase [Puniceicoccales bacterium]